MFHLLIDTSVWLDLAADQRQSTLLDVLIEFVGEGHATLVLPRTVIDEFRKNRERVAKASAKSLASHFGQVREAIKKVEGDKRQKDKVLNFLADVDHRIPLIGGSAQATLVRIDELFAKGAVTSKAEERQAIYTKAQEILSDDVPVAWLLELGFPTIHRCNVKNLVTTGIGLNDGFKDAWIEK